MTHILEDLTHNMEGQPPFPPPKDVTWVLGGYTYRTYAENVQDDLLRPTDPTSSPAASRLESTLVL